MTYSFQLYFIWRLQELAKNPIVNKIGFQIFNVATEELKEFDINQNIDRISIQSLPSFFSKRFCLIEGFF